MGRQVSSKFHSVTFTFGNRHHFVKSPFICVLCWNETSSSRPNRRLWSTGELLRSSAISAAPSNCFCVSARHVCRDRYYMRKAIQASVQIILLLIRKIFVIHFGRISIVGYPATLLEPNSCHTYLEAFGGKCCLVGRIFFTITSSNIFRSTFLFLSASIQHSPSSPLPFRLVRWPAFSVIRSMRELFFLHLVPPDTHTHAHTHSLH